MRLPTVDDIKEDMAKFTIDKIKRGDHVIIANMLSREDAEEVSKKDPTRSSMEFATVSQIKTFGLGGEVLELDRSSQLVQVETYLAAEGVLVRYWYPLSWLQKPDSDHHKGELVTDSQSVNLSNPEIHRELINTDFALSRLYCRESYLHLIAFAKDQEMPQSSLVLQRSNSAEMTMYTSSILLLQDIDVENLQLLSNACLRREEATGNLMSNNIDGNTCDDVWNGGDVRKLFYQKRRFEDLEEELSRIIARAASCGEEQLLDLSNHICQCLQHAGDFFLQEEVIVSDISALKSTISFKGSCCILVTPKLKNGANVEALSGGLLAEVLVMQGDRIRKTGLNTTKCVVQYPCPHSSALEPVILPADLVRISHSGGGNDDVALEILGIPPELPLALTYILQVMKISNSAVPSVTSAALLNLGQMLLSLLGTGILPPLLKQLVFMLLTSLLRSLDADATSVKPLPSKALFKCLLKELGQLHEQEKKVESFSSYFCCLFELMVAAKTHWGQELLEDESADGFTAWFHKAGEAIDWLQRVKEPQQRAPTSPNPSTVLLISGIASEADLKLAKDEIAKVTARLGGAYKDRISIGRVPVKEDTEEVIAVLSARWSSKLPSYLNVLSKLDIPNSSIQVRLLEYASTGGQELSPAKAEAVSIMAAEVLFENDDLCAAATEVFQSCYFANLDEFSGPDQEVTIRLSRRHMLRKVDENLMVTFLTALTSAKGVSAEEFVERMLVREACAAQYKGTSANQVSHLICIF